MVILKCFYGTNGRDSVTTVSLSPRVSSIGSAKSRIYNNMHCNLSNILKFVQCSMEVACPLLHVVITWQRGKEGMQLLFMESILGN